MISLETDSPSLTFQTRIALIIADQPDVQFIWTSGRKFGKQYVRDLALLRIAAFNLPCHDEAL